MTELGTHAYYYTIIEHPYITGRKLVSIHQLQLFVTNKELIKHPTNLQIIQVERDHLED